MQAEKIRNCINDASAKFNKAWPLYAFVTANPLAGLEDQPFEKAIQAAYQLFEAKGLPSPLMLRQAWEEGHIDKQILESLLRENGIEKSIEAHLQELELSTQITLKRLNPYRSLDRLVAKWLSAFLDQGMAEWWMPDREKGFYKAWLSLVPYDKQVQKPAQLSDLPEEPLETIEHVLSFYPEDMWVSILTEHLASMPGWTGFILYRIAANSRWQQRYPITLTGLLAVRLSLAHHMGYDLHTKSTKEDNADPSGALVWLKAWEQTYYQQLKQKLETNLQQHTESEDRHSNANAQLVFCIDTRSEVFRRHLEQTGNYETFGFAGFFGIPMNYRTYQSSVVRKSCPPILSPAYQVAETCYKEESEEAKQYNRWQNGLDAFYNLINTFKNNVPASFGFVEGAGGFYGLNMTVRTILPKLVYKLTNKLKQVIPDPVNFCRPYLKALPSGHEYSDELPDMPLEDQVAIAKATFKLTGWRDFSRLVVFMGHASHTANNPFGSSLDCGACAGSPGRYNAKTLAHICNKPDVQAKLIDEGISIPDETIFIAGEHNTTTDEVTLFDQTVPESHHKDLAALKDSLHQARHATARERAGVMNSREISSFSEVARRSVDWAETRPEWGLAGNASFIIGPRTLTQNLDFNGRTFLHTYDWRTDPEGAALAGIMNGPMVVTQWINNHYYFATVANNQFGSGSKVTQNVVGKFGVVQGNGGDLETGLPLHSVFRDDHHWFHAPLRLQVFIHAPYRIVKNILEQHPDTLGRLVDNQWIYLTVMDPEQEGGIIPFKQGKDVTSDVKG